ncbi:MAG: methyltransferase domain-containing protein [Marinobacter sp.]|nr:methyltransferase domain-containing protein [Marinobacter sp.]
MPVFPFQALACPLDGNPLQQLDKRWQCPVGHSYDQARQGHVNLLPVQHKRSREPGDSKEMVAARQAFLAMGHYQPIADAVNRLILRTLSPEAALMDAGSGEGYYLRQLADAVPETHQLALLGLDISKWAAVAAARQDRRCRWVVGSNANVPVLPQSLDYVLCLFGFPVYSEFARILKPGGRLLQVDAGEGHLRELREVIYPSLKPAATAASTTPPGFVSWVDETLQFPLALTDADAIADLLAMTPHLYRASAEGRAKAAALTQLTVTVEVRIRGWQLA